MLSSFMKHLGGGGGGEEGLKARGECNPPHHHLLWTGGHCRSARQCVSKLT